MVIRAKYFKPLNFAVLERQEEFAFNPNDPTAGCNLRVTLKSIKGALLLLFSLVVLSWKLGLRTLLPYFLVR